MPIYRWTGNPWVDTGITAIMVWNQRKKPEDIEFDDVKKMAEKIASTYLTEVWKKIIVSVFTTNHPITNPSIKDHKMYLIENYLKPLLNSFKNIETEAGSCIACGRRDSTTRKNKIHIPLTGYKGSHFFSYKTDGADYCDPCAFAVQCVPLLLYKCGNLLMFHSNSPKVMKYWGKKCYIEVQRNIAAGCLNEGYTKPKNALFHVVEDIIKTYHENWIDEKVSIRAYHFSNFGQSPSLEIYDLPASVFTFMAFANQKNLKAWKKIVRKGYGNIEKKTRDDYKNYKNMVYERLLGGVPIISYFIENETKSVTGDWELLKFYLKEVLFMEEKRIDAIRKLGDDISIIIKSSPNGKRRLGDIERSKTYADFRTVLFRLTKDNVILKNDSPLVTLDDYAKFLFPDGALGWKETQDLLLFKLYENLHGWLINEGIAIETEEDEEDLHSNAQKKEE